LDGELPWKTRYDPSGMPLRAAVHVKLISTFEIALAVTEAGGEGSASVVADATADIGETLPPWSNS
jgi:hypothetical protein